ncbi:myosin light chain kinase family member 4 isoform X2 [Denticeps clupeoides]|uniref:Protein kinase domain-containing protein n=1 Tax=Denticeps clupeoides TaxID=299321 RepID=A0AAY4CSJ7_9TELE|nr:myosin light chain kinase family member 4 isoform X2 [Denticeps clupeoides]
MERFLCDQDVWIVGSVCLIASFLWRRLWSALTYGRKKGAEQRQQVQGRGHAEQSCVTGAFPLQKEDGVPARTELVQTLNHQNIQRSHSNHIHPDAQPSKTDEFRGDRHLEEEGSKGRMVTTKERLEEAEPRFTHSSTELTGFTPVPEKHLAVEEESEEDGRSSEQGAELLSVGVELMQEPQKATDSLPGEYIIDSSPPPPAPFDHRVVMVTSHQINNYYTIYTDEVLGGGRFGQVHKCVEKTSGLTLAAKIIKARTQKDKDIVTNEIQVMNQLNHTNLIQLYAAFETRHNFTLVLEYVNGGELFDRIIDDRYNLTELDSVLFIRQICEGLQHMHNMYILHLDLKPENILCVSRETNKIKIIDFGLARKYKPREKLRVNFGTPEFLAPEVINYEFVSFPTDMWSLGVIAYMLLSGLSPFLGDDDNETLNNILSCQWSFDETEFSDVSDEAKDFITRLLVKSKSWRMSASQSLKHPWLSDRGLHYQLYEKQKRRAQMKENAP